MKANELRIGNLIWLWNDDLMDNEAVSVFEINEDELNGFKYRMRESEPIPLTEEWLVKFGFEKHGEYYILMNPVLLLKDNEGSFGVSFWQGNDMKYVHQLQNLYFALTGEELEIVNKI